MSTVAELSAFDAKLTQELDTYWLMFGAVLVFFMQTGFAMLEVGSVHVKNTRNILLKNVLDASIGSWCWYFLGFGFAMGKSPSMFIGGSMFTLNPDYFFTADQGYAYAFWLFQWAFAATTATIVSGAVAERVSFTAYLVYSTVLISFVYPVVACWGWNVEGWASAWREDQLLLGCGLIDFAGSGVVHMTGGIAAFWGSFFVESRLAFRRGNIVTPSYGPVFQSLGTLILWFGWYGFNGVSTLYLVNYTQVAAKVMVNTTLGAASGALSTLVVGMLLNSTGDKRMVRLEDANNGVLAGLVAITAGCSTVEPYGAMIIGVLAGPIYVFSSKLLKSFGIDDVVDACPVHGFCGFWGVIATAFFATKDNYSAAYYSARAEKCAGVFYGGDGSSLGAAFLFLIAVLAWVSVFSIIVFGGLKYLGMLRVEEAVEEAGMDESEHGAPKTDKPKLTVAAGKDVELTIASNAQAGGV